MEKVKLTQEQIQTVRNFMNNDNVLKLSINELHRVIDGKYEVEETFKTGDWVYLKISPDEALTKIYKIVSSNEGYIYLDNIFGQFNVNDIRQATPEEIAKEKERRIDVKLSVFLSKLDEREKHKLLKKLIKEVLR